MGCSAHPQQQVFSMEPAALGGCAGHCSAGAATEQACSGTTFHYIQIKLLLTLWYWAFLQLSTDAQWIKKLPHEGPSASSCTLTWTNWIQFTSYPLSLRSTFISSLYLCLHISNGFFLWGYLTKSKFHMVAMWSYNTL
jgi:hypothetical protein